jgi:hypothetical protein
MLLCRFAQPTYTHCLSGLPGAEYQQCMPSFCPPPPCSFPRGCGGLLEWRNAFLLFVNLPEAGERASPSRRYSNQFLWLPAAAAGIAGNDEQQGDQQQEQPDDDDDQQRLCMTWWPGRGQSLQHPVSQRLLAAGAAGDSQPAAAAAAEADASSASGSGQEGEQDLGQRQEQAAVLLFCRAGSSPFVFCGRLRPAGVGSPPEPVPAAAGEAGLAWGSSGIQQAAWQQAAAGSTAVASDSGTDGGGSFCITWELTDAGSLLDVGDAPGGTAFQQMLHP